MRHHPPSRARSSRRPGPASSSRPRPFARGGTELLAGPASHPRVPRSGHSFGALSQTASEFDGVVVQRVKSEQVREHTDDDIEALYRQTKELLEFLKQQGEDWEQLYGAKGKEKASQKMEDFLEGRKTDYAAEIRKEVLKRYWASLTTEEKLELAGEVAEASRTAAGALARAGWEAMRALPSPSTSGRSRSKRKEQRQEEPERSSESGLGLPSMGWINELTSEDLNAVYEAYKLRKKVKDKIAEVKSRLVEGAGGLGESGGKALGKLRVEAEFIQRYGERRQDFMAARERYLRLETAIEENEDQSRYAERMDALSDALVNINGPAIVYYLGELNEEGRREYPEICKIALGNLNQAHDNSFFQRGLRWARGVAKKVTKLLTPSDPEAEAELLTNTREELAGELHRVVNGKWGKFTPWYVKRPSGVAKMRKELPKKATAVEKLREAKRIATESADAESGNRHRQTQLFYDDVAKLEMGDVAKLRFTIWKVQQTAAQLG